MISIDRARVFALRLIVILSATFGVARAQNFDFRTVHLVSDVASVDVFLNDRTPPSIVGLPFGYASALLPRLTSLTGTLNVKIAATTAGIAAQFISRDIPIDGMNEYVTVAYGTKAAPKLSVLVRSVIQFPAPGNALLRVLNATTVATPFDIHLGSIGAFPIFQSVAADANTMFAEVSGQPAVLYITSTGGLQPLARIITPLSDGGYVTVIITGSSSTNLKCYALNGENPDLHLLPTLQNTGGGFLPTLRIADALPLKAVPRIDVFINGTRRAAGLNYHSAGEVMGPLTFDTANTSFTPADEGLSSSFLNVTIPLGTDTNYLCVLTQVISGAPTPIILAAAVSEGNQIPNQKLKVRVTNATEFFGPLRAVVSNVSGDSVVFDDLAFRESGAFALLGTGTLALKVYKQGTTTPIFRSTDPFVDTTSGALLTIILEGDSSGLSTDVLSDQNLSSQIPMRTFGGVRNGVDWTKATTGEARMTLMPNPFSTTTALRFTLVRSGKTVLRMFDAQANCILERNLGLINAGEHSYTINGTALASGTYTATLSVDGQPVKAASLVLVR